MTLVAGQSLSHYEILGPLGVGTMGEVYRARDSRLEREVAIKVLPEHFVEDGERLGRFEREAKALASLNHPNVAQIFGVDRVGDTCFLVLELVPGETLEDRLSRGALSVADALDVCGQIADGLEAAHQAGVVHRDLKPANVRITPEGKVKVLDFGLAKSAREESSGSTQDSALLTEAGRVLGTPTYMAPEQARGKPVDRRVDVWAFGCVLYECLTGRRPFGGETISDVLAAVLQDDPDLGRLPRGLSPHVRETIEHCLAKDPGERLRDVGDARLLMTRPCHSDASVPKRRRVLAGFAAGALAMGAAWLGARLLAPGPAAPDRQGSARVSYRFPLELEHEVARLYLAPDGTRALFPHGGALHLRRLDAERSEPIPGTEGAGFAAAWSVDGSAIAFARGGFLETLDLAGASGVQRCRVPADPSYISWSGRDDILFEVHATADDDGVYLHRVGAAEPELLDWIGSAQQVAPDLMWSSFLPDGKRFLLTLASSDGSRVHVASLETQTTRPLIQARTRATFVAPGWLAWADDGRLLVQPFDAATAALSGTPRALIDGVDTFVSTGRVQVEFSAEGTLVYRPPVAVARLEWVSREGLSLGAAGTPRSYDNLRLDPKGGRLAASIIDPKTGVNDVWIIDLERDAPRRLTHHPRWEGLPVWSPDGTRIAFQADWSGPPNIYEQEVDGTEARVLVPYDGTVHGLGAWTPDAGQFAYDRENKAGRHELWVLDVKTGERRILKRAPYSQRDPVLSADGDLVAYLSDETGRFEVYVAPFPGMAGAQRISTDGGRQPRWSPAARELFYVTGNHDVVAVPIREEDGRLRAGQVDVVLHGAADVIDFDVAPDGARLLLARFGPGGGRRPWRVVTDWPRLLESR